MEHLTSLKNDRVRDAIRLQTSRGRKQQQRIIIFGWREVERAARSGVDIVSVFLLPEWIARPTIEKIQALFSEKLCLTVSVPVFEKLSYGDRSDGVIAVALRPPDRLEDFSPRDTGPLIVLEGLEKPGNIGAVFRSADATGCAGIILADSGSDAFHPNAIRNSMGTVFSVPHTRTSTTEAIKWLRNRSTNVLLATPEEATSAFDSDLNTRCAIVLGNEANGVSEKWLQGGFGKTCLPMLGIADSLNVSATATVLMYEALRQRQRSE